MLGSRSMYPLRRCMVAWSLGALALATPAAAQDVAAAEALFHRGLADMEVGRYETGCPAIAESHRLDPRVGTLFTLAECEAQRGRLATAVALYGDLLSLIARLPADQRAKHRDREQAAREQQAALRSQVPELTLVLPPNAPAETVVKRDDVVLTGPSLGLGLPVDPGEHTISTEAPGGPVIKTRIKIARGEKMQLTLEVKASPPAVKAPTLEAAGSRTAAPKAISQSVPDREVSAQRVVAFTAGGVGLAGLILGGIMGGLTLGQKGTITMHCMDKVCDHEGKVAADNAQTTGLVSTIGFSAGFTGVTAAAVLFLVHTAKPKGTRATRHGDATWLHIDIISLEQGGAMAGLKGAW